jgi:hypothetical protein
MAKCCPNAAAPDGLSEQLIYTNASVRARVHLHVLVQGDRSKHHKGKKSPRKNTYVNIRGIHTMWQSKRRSCLSRHIFRLIMHAQPDVWACAIHTHLSLATANLWSTIVRSRVVRNQHRTTSHIRLQGRLTNKHMRHQMPLMTLAGLAARLMVIWFLWRPRTMINRIKPERREV